MNNNKLENWEEKVLNNYLDGTQLKKIPASRKKRLVVLRWLVRKFEEKVTYSERQVNEIISQHHSDYATLRREMIGYQLMEREKGFYWRLPAALWKSENEIK
ncbi:MULTISPECIES: DUF2087 domain-containing protein [Fischerella]|uniref:DUF2087 domain-containing protein n=1 Tax=Fischerella muscicola CCMEE 5323 TaxID=2019572 RepID=A0A2N6JY27_FISMU|nr:MULTISPECIES: DUF2087 domain-containing protein [Fischerella]MBD2432501.1 DUF2087 domain-containing protein [Fischerella sp. FACHB-380]PLZ85576.1 DUF2087 domain-containing protein [Fischerella muscicola CCMEE 5323]